MRKILKTHKLYYDDQYLKKAHAIITATSDDYVVLDRTIAYPEGGGQESDTGWISRGESVIRFFSTTLTEGNPIHLEGFKGGKTGGRIRHHLDRASSTPCPPFSPGDSVIVSIDPERRQRLTVSHSASHFLYAGILHLRPELADRTLGCHISEDKARFDFGTESNFSPEEIREIKDLANRLISLDEEIRIEHHPDHIDARIWIYGNIRIPCGGTHLARPAAIGTIHVSRKNLGKGKERLICTFDEAVIDTSHYHDET